MAVVYRNIVGTIHDAQGGLLASGTLKAKALYPIVDGTKYITPTQLSSPITNGVYTLLLAAPGAYEFMVQSSTGDTLWVFKALLANTSSADITLAELFSTSESCTQGCSQEDITTLIMSLIGLLDTPLTYSGAAGKILAVNSTEDGIEFVDPSAGNVVYGTGAPEGVVTADVGTIYVQQDGAPGFVFWFKEAGSGNTGWAEQVTV
jgi:hypothetical protein